jgi:metal-responsive CopG/Arc/MetJ family transcriptional regulator
MKVTVNLPDVTPQKLDAAVWYWELGSRSEFIRRAISEALEIVLEDAVWDPEDGECIGWKSLIEEEFFGKVTYERKYLREPEPGEEWKKDGEPEEE